MALKLTISESLITTEGEFLIKRMSIIEGDTGEQLKIAKVTPELKTLLDSIEIDLDTYATWQELKKKNPALSKMVNEFNLILQQHD